MFDFMFDLNEKNLEIACNVYKAIQDGEIDIFGVYIGNKEALNGVKNWWELQPNG